MADAFGISDALPKNMTTCDTLGHDWIQIDPNLIRDAASCKRCGMVTPTDCIPVRRMTIHEKRDAILLSLKAQFATKVRAIHLVKPCIDNGLFETSVLFEYSWDRFLTDLANNAAQAIDEE